MKKLSMLIIAAMLAAGMMFVGCNKDEIDPPTITIFLDGSMRNTIEVEADKSVSMKVEWEAKGDIKRIEFDVVGGSNVSGYPKERDFIAKTLHNETITVNSPNATEGGVIKYTTKVYDKEDQSTNKEIIITFKKKNGTEEVTPLVDAGTHTFAYQSSGHAQNNLSLSALGLTAAWGPNLTPAKAIGFDLTGSIVTINATEFGNITTKEALKAKFDAGTSASPLLVTVPSNDKMYFIVKNGSDYFLVETTERMRDTNVVPANKLSIKYKK